jgi:dTDP-4-amino-4,6-dideoxygalactose transaminase
MLNQFKPPIRGRKIRFALAGCGRIAASHLDAIAKHRQDADLVAVCDIDAQALAEATRRTDARGYDRYETLLADCGADIVVLATPSGLHPRQTIQAAIVLAKLEVFADEVEARMRIGARYTELLKGQCPEVTPPHIAAGNGSVYAQYTIQVEDRDAVAEHLRKAGIPTAIHYPVPLHLQPAFASLGMGNGSLPVAEAVAARVLSLPMHPYLDESVQDQIVARIGAAMEAPASLEAG